MCLNYPSRIADSSIFHLVNSAEKERKWENAFRAKSTLHNTLPLFLLLWYHYKRIGSSCFVSCFTQFSKCSTYFRHNPFIVWLFSAPTTRNGLWQWGKPWVFHYFVIPKRYSSSKNYFSAPLVVANAIERSRVYRTPVATPQFPYVTFTCVNCALFELYCYKMNIY